MRLEKDRLIRPIAFGGFGQKWTLRKGTNVAVCFKAPLGNTWNLLIRQTGTLQHTVVFFSSFCQRRLNRDAGVPTERKVVTGRMKCPCSFRVLCWINEAVLPIFLFVFFNL